MSHILVLCCTRCFTLRCSRLLQSACCEGYYCNMKLYVGLCVCVSINQQKLLVKRRSERRLGFLNGVREVPTESHGKAKSEICFCGAHGRSPSKLLLNPFSTPDLLPSPSLSLISDTALTFKLLQQFESSVCHDHLDVFIHTNYLLQGGTRWFNLLTVNFS